MNVTVVTATGFEARAARKALPQSIRVVEGGIGLSRVRDFEGAVISCGVAGGLRADLATGTALVPRSVRRPDGSMLECDAEMTEILLRAAVALGLQPIDAPMATSASLMHGEERANLAARGYSGVDMETGLIRASRVACVRVILDTPEREIDPAWANPRTVIFHPHAWVDLPFLAGEAPRCASLAARVIAYAAMNEARSSAAR